MFALDNQRPSSNAIAQSQGFAHTCKMGQARWLHAWTFDKLSLKPICQESQPHHHTLPHLFIQTKNVSHCVIVCLCMLLDSVYLYNVSSLYQEAEFMTEIREKIKPCKKHSKCSLFLVNQIRLEGRRTFGKGMFLEAMPLELKLLVCLK